MRNIVGQTPRGKDFFPRDKIIKRIYRRLDSGSNIFIAAPRRVGKTAIMRYLEDNPRENYEFKYIITESVDNAAAYFKQFSDTLHHLKTISEKSGEAIAKFLSKINKIEFSGLKVGFDGKNKPDYLEELKAILNTLDSSDTRVVIMVDEFPQTVENILRESGQGAAERFLQFNREIRHQASEKLLFILTGSMGLPVIAEKLDATKEINDLNTIEIPPLNRTEAQKFTASLLNYAEIPYEQKAIEHLLDKIEWFIPFHLQLLVQELIDQYDDTPETVNPATVDNAFAQIADMRHNAYFEHYYSRLKKTFNANEYPFALAVLNELTRNDECDIEAVKRLAQTHHLGNYPLVLRTLEFDGYIFQTIKANTTRFRFTSPVLRLWWRQFVKTDVSIRQTEGAA